MRKRHREQFGVEPARSFALDTRAMQTETVSAVAPSTVEESAARQVKRPRRRLVLCLDGTWNKRDSGTNVYHISNLVVEGDAGDGWTQEIYYDEGVGTGLLDSVTGGAFGS